MEKKYERFNEITFIAYCMIAVNRAIKHGLHEKAARSGYETSLSEIEGLEEWFYLQGNQEREIDAPEDLFIVDDFHIPIKDAKLAAALRSLPPQRRNILLLAYLIGMNDAEIAQEMDLSRSQVQYLRTKALLRMKVLIESMP